MKTQKIPEATIVRLSMYSRFLNNLANNGVTIVSSEEIAKGLNGSPAQVRKDLAYFGEFGTRGVGYNVRDLNEQIKKILGLTHKWKAILVGAGHLGTALINHKAFMTRGFEIQAVFDNAPQKIGQTIGGVPVYDVAELVDYVKREKAQIGIIAIPPAHAQEAADLLVQGEIKAILNFAPCVITVPPQVEMRSVDFTVYLEVLTYNVETNRK